MSNYVLKISETNAVVFVGYCTGFFVLLNAKANVFSWGCAGTFDQEQLICLPNKYEKFLRTCGAMLVDTLNGRSQRAPSVLSS